MATIISVNPKADTSDVFYVFILNNTVSEVRFVNKINDENLQGIVFRPDLPECTYWTTFNYYVDLNMLNDTFMFNNKQIKDIIFSFSYFINCNVKTVRVENVSFKVNGNDLIIKARIEEPILPINASPFIDVNTARNFILTYTYNNESTIKTSLSLIKIHPQTTIYYLKSPSYNFTETFISDLSKWNSFLENGNKTIPIGSLPWTPPSISIMETLVNIYRAINETVTYYKEHPTVLKEILTKIMEYRKEGSSKGDELIRNLTLTLQNMGFKRYNSRYISWRISTDYTSSVLSIDKINLIVLSYNYVSIESTQGLYHLLGINKNGSEDRISFNKFVMPAVSALINNSDPSLLKKFIESSNRFYRYVVRTHTRMENKDFPVVYISETPPYFAMNTIIPLTDNYRNLFNSSYIIVALSGSPNSTDIEGPLLVDSKALSKLENKLMPGQSLIVIDKRLAEDWMITTKNAFIDDNRLACLQNLMNSIDIGYQRLWYDLVSTNGENYQKYLDKFNNEALYLIVSCARYIGGPKGEQEFLNRIGVTITNTTANTTVSSPESSEASTGNNSSTIPISSYSNSQTSTLNRITSTENKIHNETLGGNVIKDKTGLNSKNITVTGIVGVIISALVFYFYKISYQKR
jgi:hypothetical protein